MSDELEPIVGKWYLDSDLDEQFRVVAIDEEREVVEIQYLNGEADEIELDAWSDLDLEAAEPPEEESEDEDEEPRESRFSERDAGEAEDWDDDEDDDDDDWDDDEDDDGDDDQYGSE
jgi:segregation and condensation protein B